MSFSREHHVGRLADESFDLVVIGGGVTGAGCALDAASRGLKTALVERDDFASGTSSKSSKMVHGGLRYLEQRDVHLVYEALRERHRLLHNAPHLVHVVPHLIPVFARDGAVPKRLARAFGAALWIYDLAGGFRIGKRHRRIDKSEALEHAPTLDGDRLASAYLYYDCLTDDARLTLALVRSAALDFGAVVANRAEVTSLTSDSDGFTVGLHVDGLQVPVRSRAVISAAGVWADDIATLDAGEPADTIRPAKGIHLTVPWDRVRADIAISGLGTIDKRSMFVVPWGGLAYLGTTDTDYDGPIDDPQCSAEDVDYLLASFNRWVDEPLGVDDVTGTWAGLRPLVKQARSARTADLSRRHAVTRSASGLVSITGGKLTTYREMAADAVDAAVAGMGAVPSAWSKSRTAKLVLHAGDIHPDPDDHLETRYGTEAAAVRALIDARPDLGDRLIPELPYLRAEVVQAVRAEMATTVDDVLSRRTRARLQLRDASVDAAPSVAALMGAELGWDAERQRAEVEAYRASVHHERVAGGLPITSGPTT